MPRFTGCSGQPSAPAMRPWSMTRYMPHPTRRTGRWSGQRLYSSRQGLPQFTLMLDDQVIRQRDGAVLTAQAAFRAFIVQVEDKCGQPFGRRFHPLQQVLDILLGPERAGLHALATERTRVDLLARLHQVGLELP